MQKIESMNYTVDTLKELMHGELNFNVSNDCHQLTTGKLILCPNVISNERHKMARNQSKPLQVKLFPTPLELKFVSAKKAIRDENSKKHLEEKEKKFISKAIMEVEREFLNRRNSATLSLPDLEKRQKLLNSDLSQYSENSHKKKEKNPDDFLKDIQTTYKRLHCNLLRVQNFEEPVPERQRPMQERKTENVKLSPISPEEKSNVKDKINENVKNVTDEKASKNNETGKSETVENRKENVANTSGTLEEIQIEPLDVNQFPDNYSKQFKNTDEPANKLKMLYFLKLWRLVTFKSKKENYKLRRIKKIDSFLKRLEETAEEVKKLEKLTDKVSCQKIQRKPLPQSNKTKKSVYKSEETGQLNEIEKQLTESAMDVCERLHKNLKNFHPNLQSKLKALSVLVNVKNKYKHTDAESKRDYPTPTFLIEMESRYKERKKRWENIRKRRSEMIAEKERIMKEKEEEEKRMEDLKKKERLEELKEKRRKESEILEQRKRERRLLQQQLRLANDHYTRYLMKNFGFQPWMRFIHLRREQIKIALHHSRVIICRTLLRHWRRFTAFQVERKYRKAEDLYEKILLKNSFKSWTIEHDEYVQKIQVAMDWEEAKLSEKTFTIWFDNARAEHWYFLRKMEIAESFHERKLMTKYFKKWKTFPQLIRNEKEKEKRKKLWQRKVQEFLPDYQPAFISEI